MRSFHHLTINAFLLALTLIGCSSGSSDSETYTTESVTQSEPARKTASEETKDPETIRQEAIAKISEQKKSKKRKPSAIPRADSGPQTYIVQIGAFTKRENAEKLHEQLRAKNYPVILKELQHEKFGPMFLVRLEPTTQKDEAQKKLADLKRNENLEPTLLAPENP